MDINEINAGTYELAVDRWDEPTSKPGEPFTYRRHRRGDRLQLSQAEARRLVRAGAAVAPGELQRRQLQAARRQYEALLRQVPDEVRAGTGPAGDAAGQPSTGDPGPGGGEPAGGQNPDAGPGEERAGQLERPAKVAAKGVWVDYAVERGMDRDQAEEMNKDQLIAALA